MILGFTGTRKGMKGAQYAALNQLLRKLYYDDIHHGGALGADLEFHQMMLKDTRARLRCKIYIHPTFGFQRPLFECDDPYWGRNIVVYNEMTPLTRDIAIANEIDTLIACPDSMKERLRSGTWFTVRKAREYKLMVFIVYPNGQIAVENKI